jgi:hypothetical protein
MTFQSDLYTLLANDSPLGNLVADRIYPNLAPQDPVLPYVIYYEFATPVEQVFPGSIAVSKPRIQYSVYANLYSEALAVVEALKTALLTSGWPVVFEDERGSSEMTTGLHRRDLDVRIPHV